MYGLKDILKRVNRDNLVSYLLYGVESNIESIIEDNEKKLHEAYERIFTSLEQMYSTADRQDNCLFDVITNFAVTHDNIYFEIGLQTGIELYKGIDYGTHNNEEQREIEKEESILGQFTRFRMATALEEALVGDMEYRQVSKEIEEKINMIDKIELNKMQWETIDNVLSIHNERSYEYGRVAYMQGFMDAVAFFNEIKEGDFMEKKR